MIRLTLVHDVKCNVLNETSPIILWKKLESLYMSKSLTTCLYLKNELYQLIMDESTDVKDHLTIFNKSVTQLDNVGVKVDEEDKALILFNLSPTIL